MTKAEFTNGIIEELSENGYSAETKFVTKNNGVVLTALLVGNENIRPTIYIDGYFDEGLSVNEATEKIMEAVTSNNPEFTADDIMSLVDSYEKAKDTLRVKLVNAAANTKMLDAESVPYRVVFGDLIVFPVFVIGIGCDTMGSIKVTRQMIKAWGIDAENCIDVAIKNSVAETRVESMLGMFEAMGNEMNDEMAEMLDVCPFVVATNTNKTNGATAMMNSDLIAKFSNDCFAIPSSIHEVLLIKADRTSIEELDAMIKDVNESCVSPDEVLSDHAYHFVNGVLAA